MGKIIAVLFLVVFVWWAYPHLAAGEWLAPTPLPPGYWGLAESGTGYESLSTPDSGYGWSRFDFWNNPPAGTRPATKADFTLNH